MKISDLCLIGAGIACIARKRDRKKSRKVWVKQWLADRNYSHVHLLNEIRIEPDDYRNYLRMDEDTYIELLNLVTPLIQRNDTLMRKAISPHEKLSCTLRFLATGRSIADMKYTACLSAAAISQLIPETCTAIYNVLSKKHLKFPTTREEWKSIAEGFSQRWHFPHCVGAVDGKHIRISKPPKSGSYYYNYKGFHSVVLMAIVDSDYKFIMVNVGTNGRVSDGGVIENTMFYDKLLNNQLNLPSPCAVSENGMRLPFVFVGDEAFSLRPDFLKPYNIREITHERKVFNYRLSRARNVSEDSFGMLASKFRIFHTAINMKLSTIDRIILSCCVLHNFLRQKKERFADKMALDDKNYDAFVLENLQRGYNRHSGNAAKEVRELFVRYFNDEGKVDWQNDRIV